MAVSQRTDVLNMEVALVVDDGLVAGAQLDGVSGPHGGVLLVEEALVRRLAAVVRTLHPASRGSGRDSGHTLIYYRTHCC